MWTMKINLDGDVKTINTKSHTRRLKRKWGARDKKNIQKLFLFAFLHAFPKSFDCEKFIYAP